MLDSFLLICDDAKFAHDMRSAMSCEVYGLDVCGKPDPSSISAYPLVIIYSHNASLFLYEIRRISNIPIIVIDNDSSLVYQYLDQGADDFMASPISFKELIARCRALLRRFCVTSYRSTDMIRMDGLTINKESYDIRVQNEPVLLSSREFEIMYLLASNPNKVLTRNEILDKAFGKEYEGDLRCVDVHIKKIRDKVENPNNVWSIKTVRGVGYKFSI